MHRMQFNTSFCCEFFGALTNFILRKTHPNTHVFLDVSISFLFCPVERTINKLKYTMTTKQKVKSKKKEKSNIHEHNCIMFLHWHDQSLAVHFDVRLNFTFLRNSSSNEDLLDKSSKIYSVSISTENITTFYSISKLSVQLMFIDVQLSPV